MTEIPVDEAGVQQGQSHVELISCRWPVEILSRKNSIKTLNILIKHI